MAANNPDGGRARPSMEGALIVCMYVHVLLCVRVCESLTVCVAAGAEPDVQATQ